MNSLSAEHLSLIQGRYHKQEFPKLKDLQNFIKERIQVLLALLNDYVSLSKNVQKQKKTVEAKPQSKKSAAKHNTKIHLSGAQQAYLIINAEQAGQSSSTCAAIGNRGKLLATDFVTLQSSSGATIITRTMIHSVATECFVSEHIVQALALPTESVHTLAIALLF